MYIGIIKKNFFSLLSTLRCYKQQNKLEKKNCAGGRNKLRKVKGNTHTHEKKKVKKKQLKEISPSLILAN